MTPQSIHTFTSRRDTMPNDKELKQFQLERYERMMQVPRDEGHKRYFSSGIFMW
jgi:hypothetical protein